MDRHLFSEHRLPLFAMANARRLRYIVSGQRKPDAKKVDAPLVTGMSVAEPRSILQAPDESIIGVSMPHCMRPLGERDVPTKLYSQLEFTSRSLWRSGGRIRAYRCAWNCGFGWNCGPKFLTPQKLPFCSRCSRQNWTYSIVTRPGCQCRYRQILNFERIFVRSRKIPTFPVNRSVAYLRLQSGK
jgi:hypothetical protein